MTDATVTELHPSPVKGGETRRAKDPTSAQRQARFRKKRKAVVTVASSAPPATIARSAASPLKGKAIQAVTAPRNGGTAIDVAAYGAAIALAGAPAFFSVKGMVTLFPGAPLAIVGMAATMEASKLIAAGWLARRWRSTAWIWRGILITLVAGLAVINATGVYAQLVAAHVGERGAAVAGLETQNATLAARIDVQAHAVADIDARVAQIDATISEATRRGKTNTALSAMEATEERPRQPRRRAQTRGRYIGSLEGGTRQGGRQGQGGGIGGGANSVRSRIARRQWGQRTGDSVADGVDLRPAGDCFDGRGVGAAVTARCSACQSTVA